MAALNVAVIATTVVAPPATFSGALIVTVIAATIVAQPTTFSSALNEAAHIATVLNLCIGEAVLSAFVDGGSWYWRGFGFGVGEHVWKLKA